MESAEYEIMYRVEDSHWWYRALHRLIFQQLERHIPTWREAAVLDAGCGTGAILQKLGQGGGHCGVDLADEAVSFCERRGLHNVRKADISELPVADATFDGVICSSVLYHRWVPDVDRAVSELKRVTKPGGYLFLNLPAFQSLRSPHDDAVFGTRRFTRPEVIQLLERHGLSVRYASYWTTLLFPVAWVARYLRVSQKGRDFEQTGRWSNAILNGVMNVEAFLLRCFPMPFGVAFFCVAQKAPASPG